MSVTPKRTPKRIKFDESRFVRNVPTFMFSSVRKIQQVTPPEKLKELKLLNVGDCTAQACGIPRRLAFLKLSLTSEESGNLENHDNNDFQEPNELGTDKIPQRSNHREIKCDSFPVAVIRRVCDQFYERKEYPTVEALWQKCLEDENFPRIGEETFRKWLHTKFNFKYSKMFTEIVSLERKGIVAQREHYLRHIRFYRNLKYNIFYLDQTWTSPNQKRNKCRQTFLVQAEIQEFKQIYGMKVLQDVNGWTGGFMVKGGNGRVVVNHIGGENGFVDGAEDVFLTKEDTKDYHNCMNGNHFESWIEKVVQLLPEKSVIVLDQAPYHRRRVPETVNPKNHWNKFMIVEWMTKNHVPLPPLVANRMTMLKATMLQLCEKHHNEETFIIEDILQASGKDIKLLLLPVAHCELNTIELIWAYVKGKVSKLNKEDGAKYVFSLTQDCVYT